MFYVQVIWLDSADDVNERPSTSNAVLKVRPVQDSSVAGPSAGFVKKLAAVKTKLP